MESEAMSRAWPTGLVLLVTACSAVAALIALPDEGKSAVVWSGFTLTASAMIATVAIVRSQRAGRGWRSAGSLAVGLGLIATISGAFLVRDIVGETPVYEPSWTDGFFLVLLLGIIVPIRAEFREHFGREDRREIAVDVGLIAASLTVIGYLMLRPEDADAVTAMSSAVFAALAATMFTAFAALTLWIPSRVHIGQFVIFTGFSVAAIELGARWVNGTYTGSLLAFELPVTVGMLGLAALVTFSPRRSHAGPATPPTRLGRPLLTSASVAAACAALVTLVQWHGASGVDRRESSILIAALAVGIAVRILVDQLRSTAANRRAGSALREKEAALVETDLALERVREAHDTLRDSEEHLRLVFEAAVDGIVELDESDTILRANSAFCRMVGLTRDLVVGQTWSAIAAAVGGNSDSLATLLTTGQGDIQRPNEAQPLYLESRISKIEMAPPRRLLLVRDVTSGRVADQTIRSLFSFLQDRDEDRTSLMKRTNAAIESERNRIARDLHDGPVQGVSAASLSLEAALLMIKAGEEARGMEVLSKIRKELSEEADGLRRLMSGLRPPLLEERGLIPALRETLARFGHDHQVATEFTGGLLRTIPDDLETLAYRVVQEALSNAGKHAKASKMSIHVESDGSQLKIEIIDDGVGFDPQRVREFLREGRVGLASMRERVELASGTFVVHSTPGRGTTIMATLPLDTNPARELAVNEA